MSWAILCLYALLACVALGNWLLMKRPRPGPGSAAWLIPARNEAENLAELLPALAGETVFVYDDGSSDGTSEVAARFGAQVIRGSEQLPEGWTGKNHACKRLAEVAAEASSHDAMLFLDADARPSAALAGAMRSMSKGSRVVTGFPRLLPGKGLEPLVLAWVPWILLATNPFGLVSRSGMGHNRFTNGQVVLWPNEIYWRLDPHSTVRGTILEDVAIGRLLARENVSVEVANLSHLISVRMYDTAGSAFDGMTKNSFEITGGTPSTLLAAAGLLLAAWGWALAGSFWPWALGCLLASKLFSDRVVRFPLWTIPFAPLSISIGALVLVRSSIWRARGSVLWKGRTYDGRLNREEPPSEIR